MNRPVFIAESGLFCARGDSPATVADALWAGQCAAGTLDIGERRFPYFKLPIDDGPWLQRAESAVRKVAGQLGELPAGTPLFVASSSFQIGLFEEAGAPFELPRASARLSCQIAGWMGLDGACHSISNACISGFSAIDAARSLIAAGCIEQAVILGIELANRSTVAGFAAMELLSRTACRPFDRQRDGLVLGEAVAAIRLTAEPTAWQLAASATGLDAYSMTGPDPSGERIASVAVDCLNQAKMRPEQIELIKLQAAASPGSDLAEANALRRVFGDTPPPLLSLKSAIGHTLGASGVAELCALLACLDRGQVPATAGFAETDPEIGLKPTVDRSTRTIDRAMLNLIGFGGGLASLIVARR